MERVHRCLVPFVIPVVDDMSSVLQTYRLLRLGDSIVGGIELPDGLSLSVDFLNLALSSRDEQGAFRHFLHRPGEKSGPAVHLLALTRELMNAAHRHVGYEKRASGGKACVSELSVYGPFLRDGEFKFTYNVFRRDFHDDRLCRLSVLHEHHMGASNRLKSMDFRAFRCFVVPQCLAVVEVLACGDFRNSVLMSHEDMSVGEQYGVADFTTSKFVAVSPSQLTVLDDEHTPLLALSGIEEVVTCEVRVHRLLCPHTIHGRPQ